MRYFIIILVLFCCIWILLFGLCNYWDFGILENELVVIKDSDKVFELIEQNTPIKIEISNERWGKAVLEDPEVLFEIWNWLSNPKPYPSKYISNQDKISGYIYFSDGNKRFFSISDRFQLGEYLLGNKDEEIDIRELYRILQHTLETKKNLIKMIEKADSIYLYKSMDSYDPSSEKMVDITGRYKEVFLDYISQSERVNDSNKLNTLLLNQGYQPIFHFALSFNINKENELIIISILSQDFFSIMDMNFLNRNIIYFKGPLFNFCNEVLALDSIY